MKSLTYLKILFVITLNLTLVTYITAEPVAENPEVRITKEKSLDSEKKDSVTKDIFPIESDILENLTEEQQHWFKKFNDGILFYDGWQSISEEIIKACAEQDKLYFKKFMQRLGILVGAEWSRENDVRRIDTDMLKSWGKRIRAATKQDKDTLKEVLENIEQEVQTILSK